MMKKFCLSVIICCLLLATTVTCNAAVENQAVASIMIPVTGEVTSIVALSLVGVAAIGGYLLRKRK